MKRFIIFLIAVMGSSGLLFSQNIEITGSVSDASTGEPLPGVNIMVKGSSTGSATDVNGVFSIMVPSEKSILLFSYVGYTDQEVQIGIQRDIQVFLAEDIETLEEVMVIGYGTIKKSDLTGAVSSVKADAVKDMPVLGMDQALQGRAAGVMVTNNTGAPGSGVSIKVRGIGSIARSNEPLYVIDGVPLDNTQISNPQTGGNGDRINPMSNINPDDIESLEILKDPASCAIYGARGANGVVLITTKRGKKGVNVTELSSYYGIAQVTNRIDLMDSRQYQQLVYEGLRKKRTPTGHPSYITDEEVAMYNTDWQDAIFRNAATYNLNLQTRGGSEKATYSISGGYYNTEGVVINTGFERYSLRANVDMNISEKLKVGTSMSLARSEGQRQRNSTSSAQADNNKTTGGPIVMSALTSSPVYPVYDSLGEYGIDTRNKAIANPVMLAQEQNLDYFTNRVIGNAYLDWEIIEGLTFHTLFGADLRDTKENFFWAPYYYPDDGLKMPGSARTSDNTVFGLSWVWTNTLSYTKTIGEHSFTIMAGHEASHIQNELTYTEVGGMPISDITTFASSPAILVAENYYSASALESYFGRINYSFKGRYLLQMNIRRDGSSRFGADKRWGIFPAGSVGWNMARESFMDGANFITQLKPRISYGVTGNQEVGNYSWRGSYMVGTIPNGYDVDNEVMNYLSQLGGRYTSISDYGYSWEEHTTINAGLDLSFFKNRINLNLDYYKRVSDNLLLEVALPATSGIGGAWNNAGKVTNEGFEVALITHNISGEFTWTTDFNIAFNNFTVNELLVDSIKGYNSILIEGQSLNFFTYEREPMVDSITGHVVLIDQSGNGSIAYGGGNEDRTITGRPLPKFFGGITNTFAYKGFDLSIFFQFVFGNDLYNATRQTLDDYQVASGLSVGVNGTSEAFEGRFLQADVRDDEDNVLWERNIHTKNPTTNYSGNNIDQREGHNGWVEDGSYLRLKTLTFGYSFPKKWLRKIHLTNARIYFSSNNLWTLTNYSGFDPEVSTITGESIGSNLSPGIDAGAYPQSKTFVFGFNLTF
ncbi:MAG: TonB-dependent receptor [Bacteroides sp.]|nr:TonB-dependent receptor [Bacteroides sp.]